MLTGRCKLFLLTTVFSFSFLLPHSAFAIGFSTIDGNQLLKECKAYAQQKCAPEGAHFCTRPPLGP